MISRILRMLGAVFVIILPIAITYYINRAAANVRYTLSEKIPITFASPSSTTPETVQQLVVKNIGNAAANKVVVKIDGQLTSYSIKKYSAADSVRVFDEQQPFEIVYPTLPPQAGFTIVFQSPGDGIDYANLDISYDAGIAQEALAETRRANNLSLMFYLGLVAVYIALISFSIRDSAISSWKRHASVMNPKQILQMNKPWYAWDNEWPALQIGALKEKISGDRLWWGQEISKHAAYQFLAIDTFDQIETSEYKEIIELAINVLDRAYTSELNAISYAPKTIELLRVEKPARFPSGKWNDLVKRANERYIAIRKEEATYSYGGAYKKLKETKPDEIHESAWSELISYWRAWYGNYLHRELLTSYNQLEFAQDADVSELDASSKSAWEIYVSRLRDTITKNYEYQQLRKLLKSLLKSEPLGDTQPELIDDWEWKSIKEIETSVQRTNHEREKYQGLSALMRILLERKSVGETKPQLVDDWEWMQIKQDETLFMKLSDVEQLEKQNQSAAIEIAVEKTQNSQKKEKLERQLHFIHELLTDPTKIERVEEYDDTFAPGNWANLQKVAQFLSKAHQ